MSLRGLWDFNTLPGKACDVENILLCLHFNSQIGSVLESGGHYTLQGHLTPLPPSRLLSAPLHTPCHSPGEPRKEHQPGKSPERSSSRQSGGSLMMVERGVWEGRLLHLPAFVQVSAGHDHIYTCLPSQRYQGHRPWVQDIASLSPGTWAATDAMRR